MPLIDREYQRDRLRALEPISEEIPRCFACNRMVIWPDNEPFPPKQKCIECLHSDRTRLYLTLIVVVVSVLVFWLFQAAFQ